jgi:uncharacterized membrane protein YgdD (TMEM256/DUF423 family)
MREGKPMARRWTMLGALSAALAVALGAFGAHVLRTVLPAARLATFETGVRYEMFHALGLLAVAWAAVHWPRAAAVEVAGWLFVVGTALFSGSLYLLALTGAGWLGAIAPLGGAAFIAGWLALAWAAWRGGDEPWR